MLMANINFSELEILALMPIFRRKIIVFKRHTDNFFVILRKKDALDYDF